MLAIRTFSVVLALLAVAACAANPNQLAADHALRADIEAATDELAARGRANDMAGVASLYADDALLLGPDGFRAEGRAAIDEYWKGLTGAVLDWRLETFEVHGNGGLAHQLGRSKLSTRDAGRQVRLSEVLFCVLWRKQANGEWKVIVDAYWPPRE